MCNTLAYPSNVIKRLNVDTTRVSEVLHSEYGADGQSRTGTSVAHYPLKVARLPIPPHRQ